MLGEWSSGQLNGWGVYITSNESVTYSGAWSNGINSGSFGTYPGTGKILGNCINGFGVFIFDNGNSYTGDWREGKLEGKGLFVFKDTGDVYVGEFHNGLRNGRGTYFRGNSSILFSGEWTNDRKAAVRARR